MNPIFDHFATNLAHLHLNLWLLKVDVVFSRIEGGEHRGLEVAVHVWRTS